MFEGSFFLPHTMGNGDSGGNLWHPLADLPDLDGFSAPLRPAADRLPVDSTWSQTIATLAHLVNRTDVSYLWTSLVRCKHTYHRNLKDWKPIRNKREKDRRSYPQTRRQLRKRAAAEAELATG